MPIILALQTLKTMGTILFTAAAAFLIANVLLKAAKAVGVLLLLLLGIFLNGKTWDWINRSKRL